MMGEVKRGVKMKSMMVKHQQGPEAHHHGAVRTCALATIVVLADEDVLIVVEDEVPDLSVTAMTMMIAKTTEAMKSSLNGRVEEDVTSHATTDHVDTHQYVARLFCVENFCWFLQRLLIINCVASFTYGWLS
jgi:hypothetical protein